MKTILLAYILSSTLALGAETIRCKKSGEESEKNEIVLKIKDSRLIVVGHFEGADRVEGTFFVRSAAGIERGSFQGISTPVEWYGGAVDLQFKTQTTESERFLLFKTPYEEDFNAIFRDDRYLCESN